MISLGTSVCVVCVYCTEAFGDVGAVREHEECRCFVGLKTASSIPKFALKGTTGLHHGIIPLFFFLVFLEGVSERDSWSVR